MKQTLLIIALFIGLGNLNAQDASNDATWEETIGFISKYSNNYEELSIRIDWCFDDNESDDFDFRIDTDYITIQNYAEDKWICIQNNDGTGRWEYFYLESIQIPLNKLKIIKGTYNLNLETVGDDIKVKGRHIDLETIWPNGKREVKQTKRSKAYYLGAIGLDLKSNSELNPRIIKAYQHLVYLSIKKREEARKASGDKF
jgi:hypothetical protein